MRVDNILIKIGIILSLTEIIFDKNTIDNYSSRVIKEPGVVKAFILPLQLFENYFSNNFCLIKNKICITIQEKWVLCNHRLFFGN